MREGHVLDRGIELRAWFLALLWPMRTNHITERDYDNTFGGVIQTAYGDGKSVVLERSLIDGFLMNLDCQTCDTRA